VGRRSIHNGAADFNSIFDQRNPDVFCNISGAAGNIEK
jgi:hypothetical protein